jgi:hypothetical protein
MTPAPPELFYVTFDQLDELRAFVAKLHEVPHVRKPISDTDELLSAVASCETLCQRILEEQRIKIEAWGPILNN